MRGEGHMKVEAGRERPDPSQRSQKPQILEEQERPSSGPFRGSVVLPKPRFWTSDLRNSKEINFSCFKPLIYGNLLWQLQKTNTSHFDSFSSIDIHFTGKPMGLPYLLKKKNPLYLESYFSHLKMTFAYFLKVKYYSQVYNGEFTHNHE